MAAWWVVRMEFVSVDLSAVSLVDRKADYSAESSVDLWVVL